MDKRILYTYNNDDDSTILYFLHDEASNRWVGGRQFYNEEDACMKDFISIAKLFGTELVQHDLDNKYMIYNITKGEPIYSYRRNDIMYRTKALDANNLIKKDSNPVLIKNDVKTPEPGIPYIIAPLHYVDNDFVYAFVFDNDNNKFEIEYNISTGEARNAKRV